MVLSPPIFLTIIDLQRFLPHTAMNTPTPEITHKSMDAKKQISLTMIEIKEVVFQLQKAMQAMQPDSPEIENDDAGVHNEKKVMLQQIIDKLQS